MSNIVKYGFIVNQPSDIKVIDSDKNLKEKYGDLMVSSGENERATASSGSSSSKEQRERLKEEKDSIISDAKELAADLVKNAKNESKIIIAKAKEESISIYQENKRLGYEDGAKELKEEIEKRREELEEEYISKNNELEQKYMEKEERMEKEIVDVVAQIFEKVFRIQFSDKKDILLYLVKNTILNVEPDKEFRIRVSTAYRTYFEEHLSEIQDKVGNGVNLEILNDASLNDSQCLIETNTGVFDCGIDTQLSNLIKDIKSLA
ncbi:FliH/SctL family protein [Lachnobacterium bovis]|uniref:Flagellar assembly protein FliH n=1 Tax=Lachnobacterium bovis TaxID=140626 RepID=A0A1H9Q845_9FIRM|nr:FliH/SctL family protein [Lachnobacterium bovis]SER56069.1 flagellar assembly protein FliH [Lachnobacterium bovis]